MAKLFGLLPTVCLFLFNKIVLKDSKRQSQQINECELTQTLFITTTFEQVEGAKETHQALCCYEI